MSRNCRAQLLVAGLAILVGQSPAQTASDASANTSPHKFDVASIRPSPDRPPAGSWVGTQVTGDTFQAHSVSLNSLVWYAYADKGPPPQMVSEGKGWIESQQWDIIAKVDDPSLAGLSDAERSDRMRPLVRELLMDRFHLKVHTEMRPTSIYALVQAKGGAHVKEVPAPAEVEGDLTEAEKHYFEEHPGKAFPGGFMCSGNRCTANAAKISAVIGQFVAAIGRQVVDETGLKGHYDFSFRNPAVYNNDDALAEALEDLGMKLESRKVELKTYVIDSAEKPSAN